VTAAESEKIGRLIGTVEGQDDRLGKIEAAMIALTGEFYAMREHVAPVALQLAKELAVYRAGEEKWKVDVIAPLALAVGSYQRFRWLATVTAGALVFLLTVGAAAAKIYNVI